MVVKCLKFGEICTVSLVNATISLCSFICVQLIEMVLKCLKFEENMIDIYS